MTKEQLAALLDGREYGREITNEEEAQVKADGLVVIFRYSDDNMEFRGAINDEVGCYDGGTAHLTETGHFQSKCDDDDCPYAAAERAKCKTIEAIWHNQGNSCWTYQTDIPHATFNIMEDGEVYCRGIVFGVEDLKGE